MIADAIAEGFKFATEIAKIVWGSLNPTLEKRLKQQNEKDNDYVEQFKQCLLKKDLATANLMLDGCLYGIPANLTASEAEQLQNIIFPDVTAYDILGFYCRAKGADNAIATLKMVQAEQQKGNQTQ